MFDFNCPNCPKNAQKILAQSSLWLSQSDVSSLINKDRLSLNFGFSLLKKSNFIPNINSSLKITKNLSITSKLYTFTYNKSTPQVIGVGLNYCSNEINDLSWILNIQKVDLKGLKNYRQSIVSLSLSKGLMFKKFEIIYGLGSNFNKQKLYVVYDNYPENIENQINYFNIGILKKLKYLDIKFDIISNFDINIISLMFKKSIF